MIIHSGALYRMGILFYIIISYRTLYYNFARVPSCTLSSNTSIKFEKTVTYLPFSRGQFFDTSDILLKIFNHNITTSLLSSNLKFL